MKNILSAILFLLLAFTSCNSQSSYKNISVTDFSVGITQTGSQMVDVRSPEEYNEKHIAKAINYNINDANFEANMNLLDKKRPVYFYCLAGSRSKKAADWASANGFTQVYNLESGINSWLKEGKPVVNANGEKTNGSTGMTFDDYLNHLKTSDKLVLVDFNAVWCGPCKVLKPTVLKLVKKYSAQVSLLDIDVDQNNIVANTMNVNAIPLLILYKQGKEVWRNMGVVAEDDLEAKLKEFSK